jgi:hypothetical protein
MNKALLTLISVVVAAGGAIALVQDHCADKKPAAKAEAKQDCCAPKSLNGEEAFMAEAKKMMMQAHSIEKKEDACCKSTAEKVVPKGGEGCCNAKDEPAKFKVFVAGVGYKFFGCEESAAKARKELLAKHSKVGQVQKVVSKMAIH